MRKNIKKNSIIQYNCFFLLLYLYLYYSLKFFIMKKIILLVSVIMSLITISALSQEISYGIKVLPLNAAFNSTSFEFEFREKRNSIIVDVSFPANRDAVNVSNWFVPGISNDFKSFTMGTSSVLAGYRHYTGNNKKISFFYETTFKVQTLSYWGTMKYPEGSNLTGYLYTTSLGEIVGYQFNLNKNLVFEIFAGPEFSRANSRIHSFSTSEENAAQMLNYIKDTFNKSRLGFTSDKFSVSQGGNEVRGEITSFLYLWPRFGISLGFRF